ncbi:hypothetical protein [Pseudoteredinibacter isoporae]|uniref:Uncharacterized protein n=1 Tax=Pseudoteredinibacter isoporae TaxID=570281 RepID=A0A7X0JWB7_9GAMM|nr:hypothetical protein [Pseudoteredinibacter isoporae]MBB6523434.1 hypothetical protein [Pseudoteredinibacter isoporae]NHO88945.1 hypothetical protein [Pseudoteredinibacter isoporae]NIB24347.1 hypothetical protein [Pseudoteredinibacter isoporae]
MFDEVSDDTVCSKNKVIMLRVISFLLLLCFSFAEAQLLPSSKAKPEGELALFIAASDSAKYIEEWFTTPPEHGVTISRLKTAKMDKPIVSSFLVTGLTADKKGMYRYVVDAYFVGPEEEIIWGERRYAGGHGKLPRKPNILMADPALDIIMGSDDVDGEYRICAQVTDLVSGKKADNCYSFSYKK